MIWRGRMGILLRTCAAALLLAGAAGCGAGQHWKKEPVNIKRPSGGVCTGCDPGKISPGDPNDSKKPTTCSPCPAGQKSPGGGSTCANCATGQYSGSAEGSTRKTGIRGQDSKGVGGRGSPVDFMNLKFVHSDEHW